MIWEYLREEEFKKAVEVSKGVCVVPVGCMEKHGQHLPIGTDSILATEIVHRAAEREPVCVFPTMHFGEKTGAGEFAGTVIFSSELRLKMLDIIFYGKIFSVFVTSDFYRNLSHAAQKSRNLILGRNKIP